MASENDRHLSSNFEKNSANYNNNEAETSSTPTVSEQSHSSSGAKERKSGVGGDYRNIRATGVEVHSHEYLHRREENPFSFKHFLNRDSSTSLGSSGNSNSCSGNNTTSTITPTTAAMTTVLSNESYTNNSCTNNNTPTEEYISAHRSDTYVPKSEPNTSPSTISASFSTPTSYQTSTGARPKVPQSSVTSNHQQPSSSISTTSMSSLVGEASKMKRSPRFSSFDSQASLAEIAGGGTSNSTALKETVPSDRDDVGDKNGEETNNLSPNDYDRHFVQRSYSNYDMELPPDIPGGCRAPSPKRRNSPPRSNLPNASGCMQPPNDGTLFNKNPKSSSSGGILPDFVQDHIMDPWHYNGVQNLVDFVEDLMSNPMETSQTLPDFLSDGPIIHSSSSHLADVATGLPDLDSPEDNSPSLQIARLRLENDRLRRELDESRLALAEQTRRAGELERRLEQVRSSESAYNRSLAQSMGQVEENLDQSKKRAAAAQSQVTKLKQQVKQLTAELDALRRENESLREEGAVGGDRITRRPSRTQQLSRDLMRAASNAENNLRQLLTGVENLRIMAATIENMDRIAYDSNNAANPIVNEEYLSDCDVDYDDFTGPAL